jgi:hypothetical protein
VKVDLVADKNEAALWATTFKSYVSATQRRDAR